jgi:hypothetical protein
VQNIQDYGEIEYVNLTYHNCRLCNMELIFTARSIQKHVTRRHQISPEVYRKEYLTTGPTTFSSAADCDDRASPQKNKSPAVRSKPIHSVAGALQAAPPSSGSQVEYTDDLRDVCWVQCRVCGKEESLDRIGDHCRDQHKEENPLMATTQHAFTRRTFHVCKVCGVEFQLSVGALCRHLTEAHQLLLSTYIVTYLSKLTMYWYQCCGSGIRYFFTSGSGIRIRDKFFPDPGSKGYVFW